MSTKRYVQILSVVCAVLLASAAWAAGNRQLMSEKIAKQDMKRNIVEAVIGYKVLSEGQFGLTEDAEYKITQKAGALIKGIRVDKMIYDKDRDVAFCLGYIDLGDVQTVTRDRVRYKGVRVQGFGFGTTTADARPPLMALRAAFLNAYDEMASTLVGEKISSYSEAENFVLAKDVNRSQVCAAVYGAYIPNPGIDAGNRGWGWDKDGNAFVKLQLDARKARDILGQRIRYEGPNVIEVIGRGSPVDTMKEESNAGSMVRDGGSKTEYRSLDIPAGGELKGKSTDPVKTQ